MTGHFRCGRKARSPKAVRQPSPGKKVNVNYLTKPQSYLDRHLRHWTVMHPTTPSDPLGAITQRLAGAPQAQLPHLVSSLTNDLTHCRMVLSASANHQTHHGPESVVLVHKYKTQISTLLQDKRVEARWAAVVLVKATVQVGGWEVLQGAAVWVRALLGILGVNMDPFSLPADQVENNKLYRKLIVIHLDCRSQTP